MSVGTAYVALPAPMIVQAATGRAFRSVASHADALVNKYNDPQAGYKFDLTGRQANQADFVLDAIRAEQGGLGWGCWSAHPDFGTKDKYQEKNIDHP